MPGCLVATVNNYLMRFQERYEDTNAKKVPGGNILLAARYHCSLDRV
jgi:hypothetical protein